MTIKKYLQSRDGEIFNQAIINGVTHQKLAEEYGLTKARIGQIIERVIKMQQLLEKFGDIDTGLAKRLDSKGFKSLKQAKDMGADIMKYDQFGPVLYAKIKRA